MKGEHKEFPLPPAPSQEFNFTNGAGMSYEAKHVRECLRKGKDVEDSGAEGWQGKSGEARRSLSTISHLSSCWRLHLSGGPQDTICLNVYASWDSGNCSSFGLLGVRTRSPHCPLPQA